MATTSTDALQQQQQHQQQQPPRQRLSLDDPTYDSRQVADRTEADIRAALSNAAREPAVRQLRVGRRYHVTEPYYRLATIVGVKGNKVDADCQVTQIQVDTSGGTFTEKPVVQRWQEIWEFKTLQLQSRANPELTIAEDHMVVVADTRPDNAVKQASKLEGTFVRCVEDTGQLAEYELKV